MEELLCAHTSEVLRSAQLRAKLAEVWALSFQMLICANCDHEVAEFHAKLIEMSKKKENPNREKKYLLKAGRIVDFRGQQMTRETMTDEDAKAFLAYHPTAAKFFDLVPDAEEAPAPQVWPDSMTFPDDLDNIEPINDTDNG